MTRNRVDKITIKEHIERAPLNKPVLIHTKRQNVTSIVARMPGYHATTRQALGFTLGNQKPFEACMITVTKKPTQ